MHTSVRIIINLKVNSIDFENLSAAVQAAMAVLAPNMVINNTRVE